MNIFVGNLSFDAKETDVYHEFVAYGKIASIVIVMDKKGKHSRGFGFVEMLDEKEALAAIAALNGKEILGRPINVMQGLPKKPEREIPKEKKWYKGYKRPLHKELDAPGGVNPGSRKIDFEVTGEYKKGRRTRSFMIRRAEAGMTGPMPERKFKENPMRWRKKPAYSKPWQKREEPGAEGQAKPWQKREGPASKPWEKREGTSRPWKKPEGSAKPWEKREGPAKPWQKKEGARRPWQRSEGASKPWQKPEGATSSPRPPWQKREGISKPWVKRAGGARKPWAKSSGRTSFRKHKA